MAITSSGLPKSFQDLQLEFGGSHPITMDEYFHPNGDVFTPGPFGSAGDELSLNDFYSNDGNTALIDPEDSPDSENDGNSRGGWSVYKGSGFTYSSGESGESRNGFGDISRSIYFSTGQQLQAVYWLDASRTDPHVPIWYVFITKRGSGDSGFNRIGFKWNDDGNYVIGDPDAPSDTTTTTKWLYRINATSFGEVPNSSVNGTKAYYWGWSSSDSGANPSSGDVAAIYLALKSNANSSSDGKKVAIRLQH